MSALPRPLAQALRAFAPAASSAHRLYKMVEDLDAAWNSLLRLPFEVEVQTRPADRNGPAEYADVYAHPDDVRDAVDALIDKYIVELEADVKRRMDIRNDQDNQP